MTEDAEEFDEYDRAMMDAIDGFRRSEGLAVFPRSPAGLVDQETVEHLWAAVERAGKTEEVRALVQDIARVRR